MVMVEAEAVEVVPSERVAAAMAVVLVTATELLAAREAEAVRKEMASVVAGEGLVLVVRATIVVLVTAMEQLLAREAEAVPIASVV
jgi:hypothetical protein